MKKSSVTHPFTDAVKSAFDHLAKGCYKDHKIFKAYLTSQPPENELVRFLILVEQMEFIRTKSYDSKDQQFLDLIKLGSQYKHYESILARKEHQSFNNNNHQEWFAGFCKHVDQLIDPNLYADLKKRSKTSPEKKTLFKRPRSKSVPLKDRKRLSLFGKHPKKEKTKEKTTDNLKKITHNPG